MSPTKKYRLFLASLAALGLSAIPASALDRTWIGGNTSWTDGAGAASWSPADEPDSDDTAIFTATNSVTLGSNHTGAGTGEILSLIMSAGTLSLNGFDMGVNGLVSATGSNATIIVPVNSTLTADSFTLSNGADLRLTGGVVSIIEEVGDGQFLAESLISGNGTLTFGDAPIATNTTLFLLSGGTLTATSTAPADTFGTAAATLVINIVNANGRVDLDNVGAVVNVNRNDTLDIRGSAHTSIDAYSGTLNLGEGATFLMSDAWIMNSGTINVNTAGILVGSAGSAAHIGGAAFTKTGGII